jgi:LPXTG-motif cell wall-anchored protein
MTHILALGISPSTGNSLSSQLLIGIIIGVLIGVYLSKR